jgi:hypothetical protein
MAEDILGMFRMDLPEVFGEGARKGGGFELLRFRIKDDISVVNGCQNLPQKCLYF